MLPTHNDCLLAKLNNKFAEISHDIDINKSTKRLTKAFQKRLASNFSDVASTMERLSKTTSSTLSISTYFLKSLRYILRILKLLILTTFYLSLAYHYKLDTQSHNLEASKHYFTKVSITSPDPYITNYKEYRYLFLPNKPAYSIVSAIHLMLFGVYTTFDSKFFTIEDLASHNQTFCNLQKYPLSSIDTAPDSYFSMVILSINTFLWMTYMILTIAKLVLERLTSKTHSTYLQMACQAKIMKDLSKHLIKHIDYKDLELISEMFIQNDISRLIISNDNLKKILSQNTYIEMYNLFRSNKLMPFSQRALSLTLLGMFLNILGVYASKNTNIGLDNRWIGIWDATKIAMIYTLQCI